MQGYKKTKKTSYFAHLFVPLTCGLRYFRSEIEEKRFFSSYFAHLFVPLHLLCE